MILLQHLDIAHYFYACLFAGEYVRQSTDEVGLQWDGAEHFCVSSSQQMYYDDAFSLVMVRSRNNR